MAIFARNTIATFAKIPLDELGDYRDIGRMAKRNVHSLNPAASVIARLGGVTEVSSITGRDISRIYRWMAPKTTGGTGGRVPHGDALKMLQHAKDRGLPLSAEDFFATEAAE